MKTYPTILTIGTNAIRSGKKLPFDLSKEDWIGFDKLDGSQIRVKWTENKGFHDFARRKGLLDDSNPVLLEAPDLIKRDWNFLNTVFKEFGWTRTLVFFEFLGENSFAGNHEEERHLTRLIDISIHSKGLVDIKELTAMDAVGGARVLHEGPVTLETIEAIANGKLKGMTFEGIVFKRNNRKGVRQMFKSKSNAWYNKVKEKYSKDNKSFKRLK